MAFCEYCGAPISDDAEICPACGRTVKHSGSKPVPAPELTPDSTNIPEEIAAENGSSPAEENTFHPADTEEKQTDAQPFVAPVPDAQPFTAQQPDTPRPDTQQPNMQQPNMQQPNMQQPNMQQPNMQQPNMQQPNAQQDYRAQQQNNGNVVLAEGEKAIRSYRCAGILQHKKDAFLTVTNQRVIFQGRDNDSRVTQEAAIGGITGVSSYYGRISSFGRLSASVILFILSIFLFSSSSTVDYYTYKSSTNGGLVVLGLAVLALAVVYFCKAFQKRFVLTITSKETTGNPIVLGASPRSGGPVMSVVCRSASETDRMVSELGAVIHDVQIMGDNAIAKWRRNY